MKNKWESDWNMLRTRLIEKKYAMNRDEGSSCSGGDERWKGNYYTHI